MANQYYTTHEVSKFCSVYPTTVINWIEEGILPAFTTPGGHRRVKKEDILNLMKKNNMPIPDELIKDNDKIKILVIDDDIKISKLIKTILEAEESFQIVIANNGFEGGIAVVEHKPQVILLDFLMPDIDGFEVCRRLKNDEKTKDIPIIAITVLRDEKDIKKMFNSGVSDYLSKPFKANELVDKVRKYATVLKY